MTGVYVLSSEELRRLQLVLLEMLVELDRICRRHGIRYCLGGGTLLGAVRHGGFIPWDDDVDVYMVRGEYERFRTVCETELCSDSYFFQDNTTDPYYLWGYGKLRRVGTEFVRVGQEHLRMRTGVFLDIFPRDNVPDGYIAEKVHGVCCFVLRKLLYAEVGMYAGGNIFTKACYRVLNLVPHSYTHRMVEKLAGVYNGKKTLRMRTLTFPYLRRGCRGYDREWFEELGEIGFEGRVFYCPRDYDGYLTCHYGDYMTLPPLEDREWHPVSGFGLEI